jgi:prophage maintenance system killer protein
MQLDQFRAVATRLIESSVSNKYTLSEPSIRSIVEDEISKLKLGGAADRRLPSDTNFETDIRNQLYCLWRIEYEWAADLGPMPTLKEIHATSYGLMDYELKLRTSQEIPDYGGALNIQPHEIPSHLTFFDKLLQSAGTKKDVSLQDKTSFLARLWGKIIDVHPFPDGNGRTARFAALLCLRRWGEPFIITPKVRNDPAWKQALDQAIGGDIDRLSAILATKILETRQE